MALRQNEQDDEHDSSTAHFPGVSYFWQEADKPPSAEWNNWIELLELAVMQRWEFDISTFESLRGHLEKCCTSKQKDKLKKIAIPRSFDRRHKSARRVNFYDENEDSEN